MKKAFLPLFLAVVSLVAAEPAKYVTIGDPAPALKPAKWLKGTPVSKFKTGHIYVVEFWATWCNPCKENIPHLTELAKKYKKDVSIIGVSIWETAKPGDGDPMKKVEAFVKQQGDNMDYIVAADGPKNVIADSWMKAASEGGIPCSFIIGRDGKVAWIGHPAQMENTLQQVIAGTHDVAAAREARETRLKFIRPVEEAMAAKKYAEAAKAIEKAIEARPNLEYPLTYQRLVALFHSDVPGAIQLSEKILEESNQAPGAYYMISSIFASESKLPKKAYEFGLQIIEKARSQAPRDYMLVAIQAEASFNIGDKPNAIKLAEEAQAMADKEPQASAEHKSLIKKNLAKYKAAK